LSNYVENEQYLHRLHTLYKADFENRLTMKIFAATQFLHF